MSVTITIDKNMEYCHRKKWEKKGECGETIRPFEFNVTNGTFCNLWKCLGFEMDEQTAWPGEVDGRVLQQCLFSFKPHSIVREAKQNETVWQGPLSFKQASRYRILLRVIAQEAEKREEKVVWF